MSDADGFELLVHYHQTIFRVDDPAAVLTVPDSSETVFLLWSSGHQPTRFLSEPILV